MVGMSTGDRDDEEGKKGKEPGDLYGLWVHSQKCSRNYLKALKHLKLAPTLNWTWSMIIMCLPSQAFPTRFSLGLFRGLMSILAHPVISVPEKGQARIGSATPD